MSNTFLISPIFLSIMSSLSFFSCAYTDSVPTFIPDSCFSSMCCQAFNLKSILISSLDFGRNDSVLLRLTCIYKKQCETICNFIHVHSYYVHFLHPLVQCDRLQCKNHTLKKKKKKAYKKSHRFYIYKTYLLHNVRYTSLHCTWKWLNSILLCLLFLNGWTGLFSKDLQMYLV